MSEFKALLWGYHRFRAGRYETERRRWETLAEGQSPAVMIIGCSDSRVDPATIFDTEPGQVFILRNVANLVPPFEQGSGLHGVSAALEFGVTALNVQHIVVMGHGACGGITAALGGHGDPNRTFIDKWIGLLDPAVERVRARSPEDPQRALELEGVKTSLANLRTFPFVAEREAAGELQLHGCHFAIAEGRLWELDEGTGEFHVVEDPGTSATA
ncbi:carbonic anhydrase [Sphingomonas sp. BN140010]|uniref:carbonic anhydrase n=1 Tax=Sphingomonas arvum TaxID=2992113 RepID=A0ABT3JEL8_9SPHN|nr:carbonic anhydrase [Sphingomonas sp. BN140010]MCW3797503.1 carbonic anhydrase [Sphingomonas sp. BN140010]